MFTRADNEIKEIVDVFVENIGQGEAGDNNKTLKNSSRKALERVLYDHNIGKAGVDYFRGLKQASDKRTYREMAYDESDSEFKKRIQDVSEFLTENSRRLNYSDFVNPRVFDKKQIGASLIAATATPFVAAFGVVDAITHPQIVANSVKNILHERSNGGYQVLGEERKGVISAISAWTDALMPDHVRESCDEIRKGNESKRSVTNIIGQRDKNILFEKMTGIPVRHIDRQTNNAVGAGIFV